MAWIVADMDRTLVDKPPTGGYPAITDGPCFAVLQRWLEAGNRCAVVTTDAGFRPFRAVWDCFPAESRRNKRLVISIADGAALFYGDDQGKLVQDEDYASAALPGAVPGLPPQHMPSLLEMARDVQVAWFKDLLVKPELLQLLGPRERHSYGLLLQRIIRESTGAEENVDAPTAEEEVAVAAKMASWRHLSKRNALRYVRAEASTGPQHLSPCDPAVANAEGTIERLFTVANLLNFDGALKEKGSLIWRNEVGPLTDEALARMIDPSSTALFTSCIVMNVPQEVSPGYAARLGLDERLRKLDLEHSSAPNSLWLKNPAVDKSLPVQYLQRHADRFSFALDNAVAFGDNPGGNDEPLTRFHDEGMTFVSVAGTLEDCPAHLQPSHVGGFEHGTAAVIDALASALQSGTTPRVALPAIVPRCRKLMTQKSEAAL